MATTNVNPTRMELTRLKKRLVTARRGHKLLKDKRDELMRQFLEAVRENKRIRREVEAKLEVANQHMSVARSLMSNQAIAVAMMYHKQSMTLDVSEKNVMSVYIPVFSPKYRTSDTNDIYSYGTAFTSTDLDGAVNALSDIFPKMIRLAEVEKAKPALALLAKAAGSKLRINVFKEERTVEISSPGWINPVVYKMTAFSGKLGPKLKEGDRVRLETQWREDPPFAPDYV